MFVLISLGGVLQDFDLRLTLAAGEPERVLSQAWIDDRLRTAEAIYQERRPGAAAKALLEVVLVSASARLEDLKRAFPAKLGEFTRSDAWRAIPSVTQVARGVFRLEVQYRSRDGQGLSVAVAGLSDADAEAVRLETKVAPPNDLFRRGTFIGWWRGRTLTLPLAHPVTGLCLYVEVSSAMLKSQAEASLSDEWLYSVSLLSTVSGASYTPIARAFANARGLNAEVHGLSAGSLLWRSNSLVSALRGQWVQQASEALWASDPAWRATSKVVLADAGGSAVVASGRATRDEESIDFILSVDVSDAATRQLLTIDQGDSVGWREGQSRGLIYSHRSLQQGRLEEAVFPSPTARARLLIRKRQGLTEGRCELPALVDRLDVEAVRAQLDDAP